MTSKDVYQTANGDGNIQIGGDGNIQFGTTNPPAGYEYKITVAMMSKEPPPGIPLKSPIVT